MDQRAERLLLQRRHAGIELVSTGVVRASRPRVDPVRSRELHVIDGRNGAPDVDRRLGRSGVGDGIDQLDIRRQREWDPHETVLAKIAEVVGAVAIDPKIIRVYRAEQRIVGVRIPSTAQLKDSEPGLDIGGRELEMARRHVAVGAGTAVRAQPVKLAVEERAVAPDDGVARFAVAVGWHLYRLGPGLKRRDGWGEPRTAGPDRQREQDDQKACGEQESWFQSSAPQRVERRQRRRTALSS
ncbi:MAG TPA: hypothetical protein VFZ73_12615 [Gemmatimonadaceae bacterium]